MSLSGATFKLYKVADLDALASGSTKDIEAAEKLVSTKISDDKGKIDFSGQGDQKLETSVLRYFKETTAPTGFIKYDDITCVVLGDRDDDAFNGVIAKLKEKGVDYETKASYVRCNTPTFHTRAEFKAKKLMTGDRTSLADGEFSSVAKDANGTEDGVTYDESVHKVKVTQSDDGVSGNLVADVAYDGAANVPVFENAYTPRAPKDSSKKPGGMPSACDGSSMLASFVATMGLIALAIGLRMARRKRG